LFIIIFITIVCVRFPVMIMYNERWPSVFCTRCGDKKFSPEGSPNWRTDWEEEASARVSMLLSPFTVARRSDRLHMEDLYGQCRSEVHPREISVLVGFTLVLFSIENNFLFVGCHLHLRAHFLMSCLGTRALLSNACATCTSFAVYAFSVYVCVCVFVYVLCRLPYWRASWPYLLDFLFY